MTDRIDRSSVSTCLSVAVSMHSAAFSLTAASPHCSSRLTMQLFCWTRVSQVMLLALTAAICCQATGAERPPDVKVTNIRRVFDNGQHNAFTDLVRFRGKFYLTFRSCPDGHMVHPSARVIVLASDDAEKWEQVHQFRIEKRDTRDPHFLVFQDKLFVYTGTWYSGETTIPIKDYDLNMHLGYAAWSDDGATWHGPVLLEGTFGHYIWRANTFAGKAYLCGRRKSNFDASPRGEGDAVESLMLESDDGLICARKQYSRKNEATKRRFSSSQTEASWQSDGVDAAARSCCDPIRRINSGIARTWIDTSAVR